MRERRGAAVWRVGGQVLYVFYFPSLLIMFIIFFFFLANLDQALALEQGQLLIFPRARMGI